MQSVYDFHIKGGKEVLETFLRLKRIYPQVELTMRAMVPGRYRRLCEGIPGVRIINSFIPWNELMREFARADVYVFPCHQTTPWSSILDAMSFELPVVTTDVYANREIVDDGVTGFLVDPSRHVKYYDPDEPYVPPIDTTSKRRKEFISAIQEVDDAVVEALAVKVAALIEDKNLRRSMGRAARREVEEGKHSLGRRNEKLKSIFDAATA
jgi:glycosyltransferase involved in cell wall biosynthesis